MARWDTDEPPVNGDPSGPKREKAKKMGALVTGRLRVSLQQWSDRPHKKFCVTLNDFGLVSDFVTAPTFKSPPPSIARPTMAGSNPSIKRPSSASTAPAQLRTSSASHAVVTPISSLTPRRQRYFQIKYGVERWIAGALFLASAPVVLVLFALVRLTSPGPGFYRQTRVGLNGRLFEIVKLRSMVQDAEKPGETIWSGKRDPRVTRLGRILRTTHMDELPQLLNIVRGEMSLIGPRPERPEICEQLAESIPGYYNRAAVKPGLTGLAQINLPPDQEVSDVQRKQVLDLCYIDEANASLEVRILIATALRVAHIRGPIVSKCLGLCRQQLLDDSTDE